MHRFPIKDFGNDSDYLLGWVLFMQRYQLDNAKTFEKLRKSACENQRRMLDVALKTLTEISYCWLYCRY